MTRHAEPAGAPTKQQIEAKLLQLVKGESSRESAAKWAAEWVRLRDPQIQDASVWKALARLSGTDMISTDRPYPYDENDFNSRLTELRR